jgi:DNA repair protein RecO (recombination protein O)
MLVQTKGVVLHSLKFQENSLIVHLFTADFGPQQYMVRNAFSSSKTALKASYFQPLQILEFSASFKNKGTLEYFKEVRLHPPLQSLYTDPFKQMQTLFLAETLHELLRHEGPQPALFDFVEAAILWIDTHENPVNAPLFLLMELTKFLGFYPDTQAISAPFFDLREGQFMAEITPNTLTIEQSNLFKMLLQGRSFDMVEPTNGLQRREALDLVLRYYSLHREGFKTPKSLEVLSSLFR